MPLVSKLQCRPLLGSGSGVRVMVHFINPNPALTAPYGQHKATLVAKSGSQCVGIMHVHNNRW